jgi:hypothetical protein
MLGYNDHVTSLDAPLDRHSGVSVSEGLADEASRSPRLLLHNTEIEARCGSGWRSWANGIER